MSNTSVDRNRTFRKSDYPRDTEEYVPTIHFGQRFKEDERFLTSKIVRKCITEGELRNNGDGCGCFKLDWGDGVSYYLVVGFDTSGTRIVLTGWPYLHDRIAALKSGRWTASELDTIEELNDY